MAASQELVDCEVLTPFARVLEASILELQILLLEFSEYSSLLQVRLEVKEVAKGEEIRTISLT